MSKSMIRILHSLGGCGGTLVAQCLGCLENTILLSECNPASALLFDAKLNPYTQMKEWYPEIFANTIKVDQKLLSVPAHFCEYIKSINEIIRKDNKKLIIRDYNYIDYFGVPFIKEPLNSSSLVNALKEDFFSKSILLVRHPLTQYNSLRSHIELKSVLTPDIFLKGYHRFLEEHDNTLIVKYEDFAEFPHLKLKQMCDYYQLSFEENVLDKFYHNNKVTGNFKRVGEPAISQLRNLTIKDDWITILEKHKLYKLLLYKLGYN